ncbi:MAG: hypothetical protein WCW66_05120 [Patescibacteria group bacterium]
MNDSKFLPGGDPGESDESKINFNVFEPPELTDGMQERVKQTENGQPLKKEMVDANGNVLHREERWYQKDQEPSPDTLAGHRQQFFGYDDQGRQIEELGQTLSTQVGDPKHENQWRINTQYGEGDSKTQTGKIESGVDAGHSWKITRDVYKDFGDGRRILIEATEILEQGQNPEKPEVGPISQKLKYFDGNKWVGDKIKNMQTGEETETLAKDAKQLPNWGE